MEYIVAMFHLTYPFPISRVAAIGDKPWPILFFPPTRFHNEEAAFEYVEAQLWPNGPVCPHCGNADGAKIGRLKGKTTRRGPAQVLRLPQAVHRPDGFDL